MNIILFLVLLRFVLGKKRKCGTRKVSLVVYNTYTLLHAHINGALIGGSAAAAAAVAGGV